MSATFNQTRVEICKAALRKLGYLAEGEAVTSQEMQDTSDALNRILRRLSAKELKFWVNNEIIVFNKTFPNSKAPYWKLGPQGDHACYKTELFNTLLTAEALTGATVLNVQETNVTVGWFIGICLNDGTLFWSTITNVDTGLNQITINNALPSGASIDNHIFAYLTPIQKPTVMLAGRMYLNGSPGYQTRFQLTQFGQVDYENLPISNTMGIPGNFFYKGTLNEGQLWMWPLPNQPQYMIGFTAEIPVNDALLASDILDLPNEYLDFVIYSLAVEMAQEFGIRTEQMAILQNALEQERRYIKDLTSDKAPITFRRQRWVY